VNLQIVTKDIQPNNSKPQWESSLVNPKDHQALAGTAGIFDGIPGMVAVKGNYINNMPDSEISYRKTTGARYATKDRKNMYYSTIKYEIIK
jgi:hypothetical protein